MFQKLVVASVPMSITVFSLGSIIARKNNKTFFQLFFLCHFLYSFYTQLKVLLSARQNPGIVQMKCNNIEAHMLPAPSPGFFEVRVFVLMAYLNVISVLQI